MGMYTIKIIISPKAALVRILDADKKPHHPFRFA
ncbi:hypothetical protein L950_0208420 [Sphingobacterium sp. IITKGP-BTPF85]|nr:hypothetical protein L950_0208420 [Sphingobacterium sp. IITKGP-BTPF85]